MKASPTCLAVCEEFTDAVLADSKRGSILFNINAEWFDILDSRLRQIGFSLIHKSKVGDGYTCVYTSRI